jgi:hypothetical protein
MIYDRAAFAGEVAAEVRLDHVSGYRLAVEPRRWFSGDLRIKDDSLALSRWTGSSEDLTVEAAAISHEAADRLFLFIAAGVEQGAYFFDAGGNYVG